MATRNKKENPQLPFTQLWQKQNNKSSQKPKPQAQKQKPPRQSLELFSPDLYPNPKQRRSSLNQLSMGKQRAEINNSHERISMMLLNRDKENWNTNCHGDQSCLSFAQGRENVKESCEDYSSIYERASNGKGKVGAQILQVIENNLVPFLVDKFLQLEEKTNKKIDRLQKTIQLQNQQLQNLKQRQKTLLQSLTLTKPQPQAHPPLTNPPKKSLTETADSPEPQIQHISSLLEQLALTMERTGVAHGEQIEGLEKQVKKLADRQRAGEKKLEDQFAKRILELIQTYNDNFVDLDKRIGRVEQLVTDMGQGCRASKSQAIPISTATHADKQKTNRYDPTNS